jgi:hypothetical protein
MDTDGREHPVKELYNTADDARAEYAVVACPEKSFGEEFHEKYDQGGKNRLHEKLDIVNPVF